MGFWDLSDGENAKDTGKEYEAPGGNMEPIPNNTDLMAFIEAVKWDTARNGDERFISIKWRVTDPETYANRVVFQKVWAGPDLDPSAKDRNKAVEKQDRARRMLASIDANCGGKLMQSNDMPTDDAMALALCNKSMVIKVMLWEMADRDNPGEKIRGNWVSAVKPKTAGLQSTGDAPKPKPASGGTGGGFDLDDEIPFSPEWRV